MYQSVDQSDEDSINVPLPKAERNKGPSRCYNSSLVVVYSAILIMAVVTLGTFGVKEAQILTRTSKLNNSTTNSCILFSTYDSRGNTTDGVVPINLHSSGLCGFVFWGLTSVTIVVVVWIVNSIVQAALGAKVYVYVCRCVRAGVEY